MICRRFREDHRRFSAKQSIKRGYSFVVRYVGRQDSSNNYSDLTPGETQAILDAGLALGVVQHPLSEGWSPSGSLGREFGAAVALLAGAAGLLPGMTIWLDLEGVAVGTPAQAVIDYCNEWHDEVTAVGFVAGIYIGANRGLSDDQIYWDLSMKSYSRGGSSVS